MLTMMLAAAALAQTAPPAETPAPAFRPDAGALFDRDPAIRAWAVSLFDSNHDGWLTSFEAQPALAALKTLADANHDGRVTVQEFSDARISLVARFGASLASPAASPLPETP